MTAVVLAGGLLVSPVQPAPEAPGIGASPAAAQECKIEIKVCQTIDLHFWKWETCFTYRTLCD